MNEDVLRELTLLREFGFTHLDEPAVVGSRLSVVGGTEETEIAARDEVAHTEPLFVSPDNRQPATDNSELFALSAIAHDCTKCRLAGSRTNVVFGVGDPNA